MNNKDKGLANIAIGVCGLVLGLVELAKPPSSRPTGRWSLIFGPLSDYIGPLGPAMTWMLLALHQLFLALFFGVKK